MGGMTLVHNLGQIPKFLQLEAVGPVKSWQILFGGEIHVAQLHSRHSFSGEGIIHLVMEGDRAERGDSVQGDLEISRDPGWGRGTHARQEDYKFQTNLGKTMSQNKKTPGTSRENSLVSTPTVLR